MSLGGYVVGLDFGTDSVRAVLVNAHDGKTIDSEVHWYKSCLLYTSPSPRDATLSRMPSSA